MVDRYLIIDTVQIDIEESGDPIKNVKIDGRGSSILNHPDVQRWVNDYDGRVVQIEGDFYYKESWLNFKVGYNKDGFGNVKVSRKGQPKGELEFLKEAHRFLHEIYKNYFIYL